MAVFNKRHAGYKCGLVLFFVAGLVYITGFASPYWHEITSQRVHLLLNTMDRVRRSHAGLWHTCTEQNIGDSLCSKKDSTTVWLEAVKGLQSSALAIMLLAGCYAIYTNFLTTKLPYNRFLEIATGISAVLGLSGAIIYAARLKKYEDQINQKDSSIFIFKTYDLDLSWSFGLSIASCILLIVAAVLIVCFNRPLQLDQPPVTPFTNLNYNHMPMAAPGTANVVVNTIGNPSYVYPPPPQMHYPSVLGQGQVQGQASASTVSNNPVEMTQK